jgi:hypothetical protein
LSDFEAPRSMVALSVDILTAAGSRVSSPVAAPREAGLDRRVVDVLVSETLIRRCLPQATANPIEAKQACSTCVLSDVD